MTGFLPAPIKTVHKIPLNLLLAFLRAVPWGSFPSDWLTMDMPMYPIGFYRRSIFSHWLPFPIDCLVLKRVRTAYFPRIPKATLDPCPLVHLSMSEKSKQSLRVLDIFMALLVSGLLCTQWPLMPQCLAQAQFYNLIQFKPVAFNKYV